MRRWQCAETSPKMLMCLTCLSSLRRLAVFLFQLARYARRCRVPETHDWMSYHFELQRSDGSLAP